jgi:hypothetical protein
MLNSLVVDNEQHTHQGTGDFPAGINDRPSQNNSLAQILMKLMAYLTVAVVLTTNQVRARGLENEFIRKPGQYHLDDSGSQLSITGLTSNSWSLKVTWRLKKRTATGGLEKTEASDAPAGCLRAEGWFVFVETPERIWIYDGLDSGTLVTHSEKEMGSAAFSPEIIASCPQKVWNVFPKGFQEKNRKYRKVEPGAAPNAARPHR